MTTPTGTISMSDVNVELSKTSTTTTSLNDTDVRNLAGVPSGVISMNDLRGKSAINYGTLTPNFTSRAEGQSFTFTLAGGTLPNGTYYWRVDHITTDGFDFSATQGSFSVSANTGNFTITTVLDALVEGSKTFQVVLGDATGVPVVFVTGPTCTITDATNYGTLTATPTSRVEGSSFSISLSGANLPNGTYYWVADTFSNMSAADLTATSGSFTVTSNAGSFTVGTVQDTVWEGTGTFVVRVGEASGVPVVHVSTGTLSVTDYSSASASVSPSSVYRLGNGSARNPVVTFSISNGTVGTYYWNILNVTGTLVGSGGNNSGDITNALTGSITTTGTTTSNSGNLTLTTSSYFDGSTVAQKQFQVRFYSDSGRTNLIATSPTITINAAPVYTGGYTPSPATLYRVGSSASRSGSSSFVGANISGTHTFYWDVTPSTIVASTDLVATTGSVVGPVVSNFITVLYEVVDRYSQLSSTLAAETYQVRIYGDSGRTMLLATSGTGTIAASPTFSAAWSGASVNEGGSFSVTVTPSNHPAELITYYYSTGGTATNGTDWAGATASGVYTMDDGPGTASGLYAKYDGIVDSSETVSFALRTGSTSGSIISNQPTITINNASGTVTTLTLAKTGGATLGSTITITLRIASIAAYPEARTFNIDYRINGGAYTTSGLLVTTITVNANATSSSTVTIASGTTTTALTSADARVALTGHTTKTSNTITGGFI